MLGEIAARTDGVPLFVEELTKAVLEVGAGAGAAAVPASLHASLMARLDRVPEVKEVAQVAACIGREFAYPLLVAVSPLPEAGAAGRLGPAGRGRAGLRAGDAPEASYAFKHALVRDAAHESLLKAERQRLHARIVRVLEGASRRRSTPSPSCSPGTATRPGWPSVRSATGSAPGSGHSRAPRRPRPSHT
jgi:predicted ATPase